MDQGLKKRILAAALALAVAVAAAVPFAPASAYAANDDVVTMYRLYNPYSGEHFYTSEVTEKIVLLDAGWNDEGVGWAAPETSSTPVYRLYSGTDHHYTVDAVERDYLVSVGWKYEGIGWYSDDSQGVALLRQYNPYVNPNAATNNSGSHNYTADTVENDALVKAGWKAEGIAWYGLDMGGKTWVPETYTYEPVYSTVTVTEPNVIAIYSCAYCGTQYYSGDPNSDAATTGYNNALNCNKTSSCKPGTTVDHTLTTDGTRTVTKTVQTGTKHVLETEGYWS
jgi:hypothetical protein